MDRHFSIRVTMLSESVELELKAVTIDHLLDSLERRLVDDHGLTYLEILYATCDAHGFHAVAGGTEVRVPPLRLFSLCRVRHVPLTTAVMRRKGKQTEKVPLLHDYNTDLEAARSYGSVFRALPTRWNCVVRTVPRSLQVSSICVRSENVRRLLLLDSADRSGEPTLSSLRYRIPDEHLIEQLRQMPGAAICPLFVVEDTTSVSDLSRAAMAHWLRTSGEDHRRNSERNVHMYFANVFDKTLAASVGTWSSRRPIYESLHHVAQLSASTRLLVVVHDTQEGRDGRDDARGRRRHNAEQQHLPSRETTFMSDSLPDASTSSRNATEDSMNSSFNNSGSSASILCALRLRREGSNRTPLLASTATPLWNSSTTSTLVSIGGGGPQPESPTPRHGGSTPRAARSNDALELPLEQREFRVGDSLYHPSHMWKLGQAEDHVQLKREEVDLRDTADAHLFSALGHRSGTSDEHARISVSLLDDVRRECFQRFPVDYRTDQLRSQPDTSPSRLPLLLTPPPVTSVNDNGAAIAPSLQPPEAREKRLLIQAALHLFLSHHRRQLFSTSELVSMVPDVVQRFRAEYPLGMRVMVPLRKADVEQLRSLIDLRIEHALRENPSRLRQKPEVASNDNDDDAVARGTRRGRSLSPRVGSPHHYSQTPSAGPRFLDVTDEEAAAAKCRDELDDLSLLSAAPPMADRLPGPQREGSRILVLAQPTFDPVTKRLVVFATVGEDIFDGAVASLNQSAKPFYGLARDATSSGVPTSMASSLAKMPFRWFLRTDRENFAQVSRELPMDTFFALGIARTFVLSSTVPITVGLELELNPDHDWSYLSGSHERVLVHRWRAGGVAGVLQEGHSYVVGIQIRRKGTIHAAPPPAAGDSMERGGDQATDEVVEAVQSFVIPRGSGIAPATRPQIYERLNP